MAIVNLWAHKYDLGYISCNLSNLIFYIIIILNSWWSQEYCDKLIIIKV